MSFDERMLWALLGAAIMVMVGATVLLAWGLWRGRVVFGSLGGEPPAFPPFQPLERDPPGTLRLYDSSGRDILHPPSAEEP